MTKQTGIGTQLSVGGYLLGGDVQSITRVGGGPAALDVTDITQAGMDRLGGEFEGAMEGTVYFDPAAGASHEVFSALPTSSTLFSYHAGTAAGVAAANLLAKQVDYAGNRGTDGSFMYSVAATESDGVPLEWGVMLSSVGQSLSGAGNVTSVDLGSASPGAFGAAFHLHVYSFTGTSVTFKIQESSDNAVGDAFADVVGGGFTAVTTAHQWQRIATGAINVERYLRVVASGTFSACTFSISAYRRKVLTTY
jgi:hypothetical protein